jgi:hypothetical protein
MILTLSTHTRVHSTRPTLSTEAHDLFITEALKSCTIWRSIYSSLIAGPSFLWIIDRSSPVKSFENGVCIVDNLPVIEDKAVILEVIVRNVNKLRLSEFLFNSADIFHLHYW